MTTSDKVTYNLTNIVTYKSQSTSDKKTIGSKPVTVKPNNNNCNEGERNKVDTDEYSGGLIGLMLVCWSVVLEFQLLS